jgi:Uma2 family endonuclease
VAEASILSMKVVMLQAPEELIEERRRKGLDRWDEMWEGVLHMVPPPTDWHQLFTSDLIFTIKQVAKPLGLLVSHDTGLYRPGTQKDYRVPDVLVNRPEHRTTGRSEAAELVIEVLSPDDESRDKLPFYASLGVKEALLIDPNTRVVEAFTLQGGKLQPVKLTDRSFVSGVLGMTFKTLDGPKLLLRWQGGEATI